LQDGKRSQGSKYVRSDWLDGSSSYYLHLIDHYMVSSFLYYVLSYLSLKSMGLICLVVCGIWGKLLCGIPGIIISDALFVVVRSAYDDMTMR